MIDNDKYRDGDDLETLRIQDRRTRTSECAQYGANVMKSAHKLADEAVAVEFKCDKESAIEAHYVRTDHEAVVCKLFITAR